MVSFRTHTDHFEPKQISSNSKPNTINELLYAMYVRCTRAVRIRVFIILNGFIFMHCNCIYDKWPWCVLVKKDIHAYWFIQLLMVTLLLILWMNFSIWGNANFVKKEIFFKKTFFMKNIATNTEKWQMADDTTLPPVNISKTFWFIRIYVL